MSLLSGDKSSTGPKPAPAVNKSAPIILPTGARARLIGIGLFSASLFCFSVLDATAKWMVLGGVPVMQIVWARYVGALVMSVAIANPFSGPPMWRSNRPALQWLRSLFLLFSTLCNFLALKYLQLAETISIAFAMPLIVALISGPMLGEWVGPRRLAAILVGFIGVLIITQPSAEGFKPGVLLSIAGMCCYAGYILTTRKLAGIDDSRVTLFYSNLSGALLLTPALPWFWAMPSGVGEWVLTGLLGFFAGFGHLILILAHKRAPAGILAPFVYGQIIWMTALGYALFGEVPGAATLIGGSIVIASGLYLLYRERVRKGGVD